MDKKPLEHYTSYYGDFFSYQPSTTADYVIAGIKPAYSLFLESVDIGVEYLETYLESDGFSQNYEYAKKSVEKYVSDVYNKSPLVFASRMPLMVIVATYKKDKYVIKGEFVLRVINDFIQKKITLAGLSYDEFISFVARNTPYWKDSLLEMQETTIMLPKTNPIGEYLYLLDRYETYDETFIARMKVATDIFLF